MFETLFYSGLIGSLLFLVMSIILFVKNNVAEIGRDVMGWKRVPTVKMIQDDMESHCKDAVTDVLAKKEACAGSFLKMVEDTVVISVNNTTKGGKCV